MERIEYDEFALFHENAEEFGLPFDRPPVVRRESVAVDSERSLSALVWGTGEPELVFLHGGAQNAHTWDTVALALGRPLVALDMPGHGHSDRGSQGSLSVRDNAADIAVAIRQLAPAAGGVIGMSLGGLTTIALAATAPEIVRSVVLVDVTPGVNQEKSSAIANFINGPDSFANFDDILARTIEHNPTRTVASLRRGILHNAEQRPDGSWVWRYARFRIGETANYAGFSTLWDELSGITVPLMLVRGMLPQSVVDDADEVELLRRLPGARVEHVEGAGHSVQGDQPLEPAALIDNFIP